MTIQSTLVLEDMMSKPSNSIASALANASRSADIAAANVDMLQGTLERMGSIMDKNAIRLEELERQQSRTYSEKRQSEIEKIIAKQDKLNESYQKTEISLMKATAAYEKQSNKVQELNQKLSGTAAENTKIQKQAENMKNPFDKWAIRVTGVYSALRLVRRGIRMVTNAFNAVMSATEDWEGVTRKTNDSIKAIQKTIGDELLPLAAIVSDLVVSAFEKIGQKAVEAIGWIQDNIGLVTNVLTILGLVGMIAVGVFVAANWQVALFMGAILLLAGALTYFGITAEDILGFVGGLFGGLYGVVHNVFAAMRNYVTSFAEFFANVFNDPIGSIIRLYHSMADEVLAITESLARAIDSVFGSNLADTVGGWRSSIASRVAEIAGEAAVKLPRMEYDNVVDTARAGSNFGKGIGSALLGIEDKLKNFDLSKYSTPDNKLKTAGEVKIDGEDIKMLLELSTRDYQPIYQTLTPQLTVSVDTIRETADANQIFEVMADFVEEVSESSLRRPAF